MECELASVATGKYTLVDQVLSLGDVPPASKSKLTFSKGSVRAKLSPGGVPIDPAPLLSP